jgi:hypothetical protein
MTNGFDLFLGTWRTRGQIRAADDHPAIDVSGTDSYELLVGNSIILHRVDVMIGGDQVRSVEIIGPDKSNGDYFMHSYDANGDAGIMQAKLEDNIWTFQGKTERFTGGFSENNTVFSGLWERSGDGVTWLPWMDIHLERG